MEDIRPLTWFRQTAQLQLYVSHFLVPDAVRIIVHSFNSSYLPAKDSLQETLKDRPNRDLDLTRSISHLFCIQKKKSFNAANALSMTNCLEEHCRGN